MRKFLVLTATACLAFTSVFADDDAVQTPETEVASAEASDNEDVN